MRSGGARTWLFAPGLALLLLGCGTGNELRSPDGESRLRIAAAAEANGQLDIALSMYAAAAQAEPANAEVQARYARALLRAGNRPQAEQVLARAVERRPGDPALLMELGRQRLIAGQAEAALANFDRVLSVSSRDVDALDLRGVALDMLGRHRDAQDSYRRALAIAPTSLRAANNLGLSLLLDGRPDEARAVLEPLTRRADATERVQANYAAALGASADGADDSGSADTPPPRTTAAAPRPPRRPAQARSR